MIVPVDRAWHWAWGAATTASLRRNRQQQLLCNFNVSSKISSRKSRVHKICDIRMINYNSGWKQLVGWKTRLITTRSLDQIEWGSYEMQTWMITAASNAIYWMDWSEFEYVQFFSEVAVKYLKTSFLFVWGFLSVFLELNKVKEIWAGAFRRTLEKRTKHHFQKAP